MVLIVNIRISKSYFSIIFLLCLTFGFTCFETLEAFEKRYEIILLTSDYNNLGLPKKIDDNGLAYITRQINGHREIEIYDYINNQKTLLKRDGLDLELYDVSDNGTVVGTEIFLENRNGQRVSANYSFSYSTSGNKQFLFGKQIQNDSPVFLRINDSSLISSWNWNQSWHKFLPDNLRQTAQQPSFFILASQINPFSYTCFPNPEPKGKLWSTHILAINNHNNGAGTISYEWIYPQPQALYPYLFHPGKAFFWDAKYKKFQLIGSFNDYFYSNALDVNDLNQVVGSFETDFDNLGNGIWHAFYWDVKFGFIDLGCLKNFKNSVAIAISNQSEVIGFCTNKTDIDSPFIWTKELGMVNLNHLIATDSGVTILTPIDINNNGDILCKSYRNGTYQIIVLKKIN